MKKHLLIILLLASTLFVKAQETPPAVLKAVNAQFYINLADSAIWHNKGTAPDGSKYGWERLARYKELLTVTGNYKLKNDTISAQGFARNWQLINLLALKENLANKATSYATVNNTLYPTIQLMRDSSLHPNKNLFDVTNKVTALLNLGGIINKYGVNTVQANSSLYLSDTLKTNGVGFIKTRLFVGDIISGYELNLGRSKIYSIVDTTNAQNPKWGILSQTNIGYTTTPPSNAAFTAGFFGYQIKSNNTQDLPMTILGHASGASIRASTSVQAGAVGNFRKLSTIEAFFTQGSSTSYIEEGIAVDVDFSLSNPSNLTKAIGIRVTDIQAGLNGTGLFIVNGSSIAAPTGRWGQVDTTGYNSRTAGSWYAHGFNYAVAKGIYKALETMPKQRTDSLYLISSGPVSVTAGVSALGKNISLNGGTANGWNAALNTIDLLPTNGGSIFSSTNTAIGTGITQNGYLANTNLVLTRVALGNTSALRIASPGGLAYSFKGYGAAGSSTGTQSNPFTVDTLGNETLLGNIKYIVGSDATNDMHYRLSTGFLGRIAPGTTGQILSNISGVPSFITTNLNLTGSGNGALTTIVIAHGLSNISGSSKVIVQPLNSASGGVQYATVDATNVNITYTVAPLLGTNNLSYTVSIIP